MNTHARNARLCLGGAVICVLFLIETFVAHQSRPNSASIYVWSLLGVVALVLLVLAGLLHLKSRSEEDADELAQNLARSND